MSGLLILHVPHTSGRYIKKHLRTNKYLLPTANIKITIIHNPVDIIKFKKLNEWNNITKYFVLRDPIERVIGQYKHYSRNLKGIGIVNHLTLSDIIKTHPTYDVNNIKDYLSLERNRNLYCKFLLGRENFNIPIGIDDYNQVINTVNNTNNDIFYDIFEKPMKLTKLHNYINFTGEELDINIQNIIINRMKLPNDPNITESIIKYISKLNSFDLKLYKHLNM